MTPFPAGLLRTSAGLHSPTTSLISNPCLSNGSWIHSSVHVPVVALAPDALLRPLDVPVKHAELVLRARPGHLDLDVELIPHVARDLLEVLLVPGEYEVVAVSDATNSPLRLEEVAWRCLRSGKAELSYCL